MGENKSGEWVALLADGTEHCTSVCDLEAAEEAIRDTEGWLRDCKCEQSYELVWREGV